MPSGRALSQSTSPQSAVTSRRDSGFFLLQSALQWQLFTCSTSSKKTPKAIYIYIKNTLITLTLKLLMMVAIAMVQLTRFTYWYKPKFPKVNDIKLECTRFYIFQVLSFIFRPWCFLGCLTITSCSFYPILQQWVLQCDDIYIYILFGKVRHTHGCRWAAVRTSCGLAGRCAPKIQWAGSLEHIGIPLCLCSQNSPLLPDHSQSALAAHSDPLYGETGWHKESFKEKKVHVNV